MHALQYYVVHVYGHGAMPWTAVALCSSVDVYHSLFAISLTYSYGNCVILKIFFPASPATYGFASLSNLGPLGGNF